MQHFAHQSFYLFILSENASMYAHHATKQADILTRGQSNLAKAASNAPHTLHAHDTVVVAVPEIHRQSKNLKAGHVTPTTTLK